MNRNGNRFASKTAAETAGEQRPELVTQDHGGALLAGGMPGNRGGSGRPVSAFTARMRQQADRGLTALEASGILDDPSHPLYLDAAKWCANYGYGRPVQRVESTGLDGYALIPPGRLTPEQIRYHVKAILAGDPQAPGEDCNP